MTRESLKLSRTQLHRSETLNVKALMLTKTNRLLYSVGFALLVLYQLNLNTVYLTYFCSILISRARSHHLLAHCNPQMCTCYCPIKCHSQVFAGF